MNVDKALQATRALQDSPEGFQPGAIVYGMTADGLDLYGRALSYNERRDTVTVVVRGWVSTTTGQPGPGATEYDGKQIEFDRQTMIVKAEWLRFQREQ